MPMKQSAFLAIASAALVSLAGCSASADIKAAEQAVPHFHEQLDGGQFEQIWAGTSDDLKKVATQADFVALLTAVHRKLGGHKSEKEQGWSTNVTTSGTFVSLTYATAYDGGDAVERFVFRMDKDRALLAGYNINSNALILK